MSMYTCLLIIKFHTNVIEQIKFQ